MTSTEPQVVAKRSLRDPSSGESVELAVYQPEPDPKSQYGDWVCRVEVSRGNEITLAEGHGVDSLQALVSGIAALRHTLKLDARHLVWLGSPGEIGVPLVIQEDDPDFIALIEHLWEAEHSRQILWRKQSQKKPGE